jgi:hypothetical protein
MDLLHLYICGIEKTGVLVQKHMPHKNCVLMVTKVMCGSSRT